ncbi:hypothetical protein P171DRAFT_495793 [Karstenula rhodostoma CBS 690.94]|uniref:GPI inositol-deacylase n=1 Tax=Karstenula rhodostoma CBS 690.94 TaxID=1392251 RepID=A0A9P4PJ72_9PLEO|nr:hypothetical protein P171DRAFT_495793 [Karstenula rhodostoma CBS 690.94]
MANRRNDVGPGPEGDYGPNPQPPASQTSWPAPSSPVKRRSTVSRIFTHKSSKKPIIESTEDKRGKLGLNLICDRAEPLVEIVFVHGLGGGSRKTWCKDDDPRLYWPKEWLQRDPEFRNARVYSFGYDSEWVTRKDSQLDVHDFGKSLLSALLGDRFIRRGRNIPIVLVAHSMGGLVIKKAFLLSRNDPAYQPLGERFHCMYFLATPHHGAASAELLSFVLRASFSGNRPFVTDLHQDSPTIQQINDEFRHSAFKLAGGIFSFYETKPMSLLGIGERFIVPKSSAITNLPNEQSAPLPDANHREVCKFKTQTDGNFLTIRNAFMITVDKIKEAWHLSHREELRNQKRRLRKFLFISEQLEGGSIDIEEAPAAGSCEWLVQSSSFQQWRDSSSTNALFWLSGRPGVGKTYLTNYVKDHLSELGNDYSSFFFLAADGTLTTLSNCLLSIAYQMACSNTAIREAFLDMQEDDVQIDKENYLSIWKKLFQGTILQTPLLKTHFWIIDALDECKHAANLFQLILKTQHKFPLRVFVSSRPSNELHGQIQGVIPPPQIQFILPEYTRADIRRYVEENAHFTMRQQETKERLVQTLVERSEGLFLWVKLVMKELKQVYSDATLKRVLEDIPTGMDELYSRSLLPLGEATHGRPLTRAILTWTACAVRPLSSSELQCALQIHINDEVFDIDGQVSALCGHLVYVDQHRRVQMVHQTARTFLLKPGNKSAFALDEKECNGEMAMTCLKRLLQDSFKAPQSRKQSLDSSVPFHSPFDAYATKFWYEHINKASSQFDGLHDVIYKFLGSRQGYVLTWIEQIANSGDLSALIRCGTILRTYMKRRANHMPVIKKEGETILSWSTDLIRIVSKFGRNLLRSPSSIYHIIPPLCPHESAPYKQFGRSARGISILGLTSVTWDDCLATIAYHKSTATAVACGTVHFAIGASDKHVRLYNTATCQTYAEFLHGEAIRTLEFNVSGQLLASASGKSVCVWDIADKKLVARFSIPRPCVAITFTYDNQYLMAACHDNQIHTFDIYGGEDGHREEQWFIDTDSEPIYRLPDTAAFSLEHGLLAVVYRAGHIHIWSWDDGYLGCCKKPHAEFEVHPFHASSLCFNPAQEANSLAAAYEGGTILVFDPLDGEGEIKASYKADTDTQVLSCSPCGRTLISGDSVGVIRLFDFESFPDEKLKLLYVIRGQEDNIRSLAFCADSSRFIDIRGQRTNIWEPAALIRNEVSEEMSETASLEIQEATIPEAQDIDMITALCADELLGKYILCGTEGGSVKVFSAATGKLIQTLYQHNDVAVVNVICSSSANIVASADAASRVLVYKLKTKSSGTGFETTAILLDHRMPEPIENLIFHPNTSRILIATTTVDRMCSLTLEGEEPISLTWATRNRGVWLQHPSSTDHLLLITRSAVRVYSWSGLQSQTPAEGVQLLVDQATIPTDFDLRAARGVSGKYVTTEYSAVTGRRRSRIRMLLWELGSIPPATSGKTVIQATVFTDIAMGISSLIGTLGCVVAISANAIIFLDDDGWICSLDCISLDLAKTGVGRRTYKRHLFLPTDWLSTNNELLFACSDRGDVVVAQDGEVAIIRRGLECTREAEFPAVAQA